MALAFGQNLGAAADENIGEAPPILVVVVDDQGDTRVLANVSQPLQLIRRDTLGLLIDGRIEALAVEDETDGDDVRLSVFVRGCEVGDAGGANERFVVLIQCKMQSAN